jgi:nucleoside-diphosphate-sugar epimerase
MASLLVIGGSGFFGKSLLDMFQRGKLSSFNLDRVIVMSRNAKRLKLEVPELVRGNVELVELDIVRTNYLPEADYVIHAAASTDARNYLSAGEKERENIQAGTLNYCRLARNNKNTKTLYVSSGAVYGTQPLEINQIKESYQFLDSNDIPESKRDYVVAKRDAEKLIKELGNEGLSVSIARCFAFVGPWLPLDQHFAIGNFIRDGLLSEFIEVNATQPVYRSYMYTDDLIEWLLTIIAHSSNSCPIYNVGSDQSISIDELAHKIGNYFGKNVKFNHHENKFKDCYVPSIEKAKKELNLKNKVNLDEAIFKTVKLLRMRNKYA